MRLQGYIFGWNNKPVAAAVTLIDNEGQTVSFLQIEPGQQYTLDIDETAPGINDLVLVFSSPGYTSKQITVGQLRAGSMDIYLQKVNTWLLVGLAMALFYALYTKKRKVGALTTKEILPFILIAGAVLGFKLFEQLLQSLGIWKDRDEKALDAAAIDANSFWNPNYWKTKPPNVSYTRPITQSMAFDYARQINDSFGPFNDCEECVKSVFRQMPSQAAASFVSDAFTQRYGLDLLDFLRGGVWPQDRLSSSDVAEINSYVLSLPKY